MRTRKPTLIVVLGPTASGKTALAIQLAQLLSTEIVNADSRQVYRELPIGSAAPSRAEQALAKHYLVGQHSIQQRYSCGQFEQEALQVLNDLFARLPVAILCGGSMLYIDSVCNGISAFPEPNPALRAELTEQLEQKGPGYLAQRLKLLDPYSYATLDLRNGARLVRALEVSIQTGIPFSQFKAQPAAPRPFDVIKVGLQLPLAQLEQRIARRTQKMMDSGLAQEARTLLPYRHLQALKAVGYPELFEHLLGHTTLDTALNSIRLHTRQYAKKQLTWWKRDHSIAWYHPDGAQQIFTDLLARLPHAVL